MSWASRRRRIGTAGPPSQTMALMTFGSPLVAGAADLLLDAKAGLNQSSAASALSHGQPLTADLNHGRLDVYQAISAWVNSSGSTSTSGSGTCLLLCL